VGTDTPEESDEAEASGDPVQSIKGIGPAYAERLNNEGIVTVTELAAADAVALSDAIDVPESVVAKWIDRAAEN